LSLKNEVGCRQTGLEPSLLAFALLLCGFSRCACRLNSKSSGFDSLDSVADLDLNRLFKSLSLSSKLATFGQRSTELAFGSAIPDREAERESDAKGAEVV